MIDRFPHNKCLLQKTEGVEDEEGAIDSDVHRGVESGMF